MCSILDQASGQATFGYHTDQEYTDVEYTLVTLLAHPTSSMHVAGAPESFTYERVGSSALFPSCMFHRSDDTSTKPLKLTLFSSSERPQTAANAAKPLIIASRPTSVA